jgi:uncharacterized SAM-binding protein YcdF (DUF218 family)
MYVMLSLQPVSGALIRRLQGPHASISSVGDARGARAVVVIGSGALSYSVDGRALHQLARRTAFAVLEGERLYRLLEPDWVLTSGGIPDPSSLKKPESEVMRDALVELGVPADRILLESQSHTTADQMAAVAWTLRHHDINGPIVVVMTAAHARRVMATAREHDLDVVPSVAAGLEYGPVERRWRRWLPSLDALRGSESAMYEYLAVAYYWITRRGAAN